MCKKHVGIIGAGPAGCFCALNIDSSYDVTLIDMKSPLLTILPTGGGRCNLAHAQFDFKELAKNYPRGEKFLYSVFSRFSTQDTLDAFEKLGIKTYIQDDMRIFPTSNSAKEVREKILNRLNELKNCRIQKERVLKIEKKNQFEVTTDLGFYKFDILVMAIGGHSNFKLIENLGHEVVEPKPALVALKCKEDLKALQGISLKNVSIKCGKECFDGDLIFTNDGISGPSVFKLSSIKAREEFPYIISIKFVQNLEDFENDVKLNPQKSLKNILTKYLPKTFCRFIFEHLKINLELKCADCSKKILNEIKETLINFKLTITSTRTEGEIVTCGGVDLRGIKPKELESKETLRLYFCGEVMDIDGFCGGFNLQSCWSTAFCVSESINLQV